MIQGRAISNICRELAESAESHHQVVLAQILRMAALQASESGLRYAGPVTDIREQIVGTWDWDIINDRVYSDGPFARLFGITDDQAARGSPIKRWLNAIHPHDVDSVSAEIERTIKSGHVFALEYRVIAAGEVRWIYARGRCTYDQTGEAVRFTGAVVDITEEKIEDDQLSIAPQ